MNEAMILVHPIIGWLVFTDYDLAADTADDIGGAYDLNEIGTLKSRVVICHDLR